MGLLLLCALLATAPDAGIPLPDPEAALVVPGAIDQTEVEGLQEALGVPVRLRAVRSREKPEALRDHFIEAFQKAGLYVPHPHEFIAPDDLWHVTGLDIVTQTSYSVLLQPNLDGTTTVLVGRAFLHARRPSDQEPPAPVFPGAEGVLVSRSEGGRTLGYELRGAGTGEVRAFYRDVLLAEGFREVEPGLYEGDGRSLRIRATAREGGTISVMVVEVVALVAPPARGPDTGPPVR